MSDAPDEDYEIVEGIRWSDLTEPDICLDVETELQSKVNDISNQLLTDIDAVKAGTQPINVAWRKNARHAMNATKDEIKDIIAHRVSLQRKIRRENEAKTVAHAEATRKAKLDRIAKANSLTETQLMMFKEEAKRLLTGEQYETIWEAVRFRLSPPPNNATVAEGEE